MKKECEKVHKVIEKTKFTTYVLYDEMYLSPGFFIISEKENEIVKFAKIFAINHYGFRHYHLRAYEKDSIDIDTQAYRNIELIAKEGEKLFEVLGYLAINLDGNSVLSIDPVEHGENQLSAILNIDNSTIIFSKDVLGVKRATDFIDISIGDQYTCQFWEIIDNFYQDLAQNVLRETKDEDIGKILKLTN